MCPSRFAKKGAVNALIGNRLDVYGLGKSVEKKNSTIVVSGQTVDDGYIRNGAGVILDSGGFL